MSQWDEILSISSGATCAFRENRGGGRSGMQSVLNVLDNRAKKNGTTIYVEATKKWQFSSMTAPGDPQLTLYVNEDDPEWPLMSLALNLAQSAWEGQLNDITDGATSYYAASMSEPPDWAASMTKTVEIEGQIFFK